MLLTEFAKFKNREIFTMLGIPGYSSKKSKNYEKEGVYIGNKPMRFNHILVLKILPDRNSFCICSCN